MRVGPVPVVVLLLAGAATAAGFSTLDLRRADREPPGFVIVQTSPPAPEPEPAASPTAAGEGWSALGDVVLSLVLLVAVAAVLAGGWLLWRRLRRPGARGWYRLRALRSTATSSQPEGLDGERLLAAVDEAVARSEDDPDPRRAVIACWVRLAEAAHAAGIPRHGSDTATDLVVRLLRGSRVSEPVLSAFVEAYWLARYATHTVDEHMRTQARSALQRLRAELRAQVGVS